MVVAVASVWWLGALSAAVGLTSWVLQRDRTVAWERAEVATDGRTVTIWYEPPCGSEYSRADVGTSGDAVRVTIYVRGTAPACPAVYELVEVDLDAPGDRVDPHTPVVDGS